MKKQFKKIDLFIRHLNHRRLDLSKAFVLKIFKLLFDQKFRLQSIQYEKNILVFRVDNKLGDSITSTGFLKTLRNQFPDGRLIVVSGPSTFDFFKSCSFVDSVFEFKKGVLGAFQLYFQLKQNSYQSIIYTSHIVQASALVVIRFLKAENKICFLNSNYQMFSSHVLYDADRDHVTIRYQKTLELFKKSFVLEPYHLELNPSDFMKAKSLLDDLIKQKLNIVVLNSFAGARGRSLSEDKTIEIVKNLLKNPQNIILSIGQKNDLHQIKKWQNQLGEARWICFEEYFEFSMNCAFISLCDLVITPDTSIVHIASALKKKLVCIYREDVGTEKNNLMWAPMGTDYQTIIAPRDLVDFENINTFDVAEVGRAVNFLLMNKSGSV